MVFAIGDWVYVKLCRQTSLSGTTYQKMGKWYYGPYQITKIIGSVAYKVALPESAKIHPVFHSSLLKPYHDPSQSEQPLPPTAIEGKPTIQQITILDHKWDSSDSTKRLVLVQWLGLQPEDSTWEDWTELQANYHLEDKVFHEGVRNDRTQGPMDNHKFNRISKRPQSWDEYIP